MMQVAIYDRTILEGTRGLGLQLSIPEKLAFVELLDDLGVAYIEAGAPGVDVRDATFFGEVLDLQLHQSKLVAFGHIPDHPVDSVALAGLLDCGAAVICLGANCWRQQLLELGNTETDGYLTMVRQTISAAKVMAEEVFFDAEHFFDAYVEDAEFAMGVVQTAIDAGAERIILSDDNGGTLSNHLGEIVARVTQRIGTPVGIAAQNDADLAVSNTLAAVKAGADLAKGTINGYGERSGSANLVSVIPALELKMGMRCLPEGALRLLTQVARNTDQLLNQIPRQSQSYVGRNAFARRDHLALRTRETGEHVSPRALGNQSRLLMPNSASSSDVLAMLADLGVFISPEDPKAAHVIDYIHTLETQGYRFEGAEASLRLLVNEALGRRKVFFSLDTLNVTVLIDGPESRSPVSTAGALARIRMRVGGEIGEAGAEGNGPINAMDGALRAVTQTHYPALRSVRLQDYKVRILSSGVGSESMCRVLIQSGDGDEIWGTVGVSTNVIQASWLALVDAFEYKLLKDGVDPIRPESPEASP